MNLVSRCNAWGECGRHKNSGRLLCNNNLKIVSRGWKWEVGYEPVADPR